MLLTIVGSAGGGVGSGGASFTFVSFDDEVAARRGDGDCLPSAAAAAASL